MVDRPNPAHEQACPGAWAGFLSGPHRALAPLGHSAGRRDGPATPAITAARRRTEGTTTERRERRALLRQRGPGRSPERVDDCGGGSAAEVVDGEGLPTAGGLLPGVLQQHTRWGNLEA
jgi:hypothetical protein